MILAATDGCVRGRYAPSPTGRLHLGNLRTALLAWLQVRLAEGCFILRMDDLDGPRTKPGAAAQIIDDLQWIGLDWDIGPEDRLQADGHCATQSMRTALYQAAFETLLNQGQLFPCGCSRKDIAQAQSAPHARDHASIYPGTCRPMDGEGNFPQTTAAAWRFRIDRQTRPDRPHSNSATPSPAHRQAHARMHEHKPKHMPKHVHWHMKTSTLITASHSPTRSWANNDNAFLDPWGTLWSNDGTGYLLTN